MERGRRNKRPGRQGATGKQSQQKADPGEDVTITLTKMCRQDSMFSASSFAAKGLVCFHLTAQIPFHAYKHSVPKRSISNCIPVVSVSPQACTPFPLQNRPYLPSPPYISFPTFHMKSGRNGVAEALSAEGSSSG